MEILFMNPENSKTNQPYKFILNLSQILDLRSSNSSIPSLFTTCGKIK